MRSLSNNNEFNFATDCTPGALKQVPYCQVLPMVRYCHLHASRMPFYATGAIRHNKDYRAPFTPGHFNEALLLKTTLLLL